MPIVGFDDATNQNGGAGRSCGSGGPRRAHGQDADGRVEGAEVLPRHAGTATCKMCLHMDVCKAREAALTVNLQFASMRFINMDTPIIVPDRLAERCSKYTPPNKAEIAEAIKHELR